MSNYINEHDGFTKEISREFFRSVYSYMFGALAISGIIAYWIGNSNLILLENGMLIPKFIKDYFLTSTGGISPLFYVIMFAPVGLALLIQTMYNRLSMGLLMGLFIAYAVLIGLSLSTIFLAYSGASIAITFFVSAGAFAGMAVLGYTTKTDLTKMGSLLYMAFIGIFIAGIVNVFLGSGMLGFIIAVVGVFVFTGLTAYFMQNLKKLAEDSNLTGLERNKLALIGGLQLYILFINLFLSLLRLLGNRD